MNSLSPVENQAKKDAVLVFQKLKESLYEMKTAPFYPYLDELFLSAKDGILVQITQALVEKRKEKASRFEAFPSLFVGPWSEVANRKKAIRVNSDKTQIAFFYPFDRTMNNHLWNLFHARWNGDIRARVASLSEIDTLDALLFFASKNNFAVDEEVANIPLDRFGTEEKEVRRITFSLDNGIAMYAPYNESALGEWGILRSEFGIKDKFLYQPEPHRLVSAVRQLSIQALEGISEYLEKWEFENREALDAYIKEAQEQSESGTSAANIRRELSKADNAEVPEEWTDELGFELYPYQRAGVKYAFDSSGVIIGDEMGLGKTAQGIATIHAKRAYPAVFVVPAFLTRNWCKELFNWLPKEKRISLIEGKRKKPFEIMQGDDFIKIAANDWSADVVVLSDAILTKYKEKIIEQGFQGIVVDESHRMKNIKAKRTESAIEVAQSIPNKILLTGTAVVNNPCELTSQLQIIGKLDDFGGFWDFAYNYCDARKGHHGWDFSGASNTSLLNRKLRECCYVRREKSDVLSQLPNKKLVTIPLSLTNASTYKAVDKILSLWVDSKINKAQAYMSIAEATKDKSWLSKGRIFSADTRITTEDDVSHTIMTIEREDGVFGYTFDEWNQQEEPSFESLGGRWLYKGDRGFFEVTETQELRSAGGESPHLTRIEILKQLSVEGKLKEAVQWVENFLESGQKLVLFATHRKIVEHFAKHFNAPFIHGGVSSKKKDEAVERFQSDPNVRLIVGNIQAMGVGYTMTAASDVAFLELAWTPGEHQQAEDRVHRIGQENAVTAWYLLGAGTIELDIAELIEKKRVIVDSVNADKEVSKDLRIALEALEVQLFGESRTTNPTNKRLEDIGQYTVNTFQGLEGWRFI